MALAGCSRRLAPSLPLGDGFPGDVPDELPSEPEYIYFTEGDGSREDFANISRRKHQGFAYNLAGIDITFGDGVPLLSPVAGRIARVDSVPDDGTRGFVDYGIAGLLLAHLKDVYVRVEDHVDRTVVIGRQGKTGRLARGKSHTHLSVAGNALVHELSGKESSVKNPDFKLKRRLGLRWGARCR